jgi:hypothetical protein
MRPPEPAPASFFDRVYASLFIVVLLAILGGMFVTWAAQSAMYRQKSIERGEYVRRDQRPREMVVFYFLGITDWRLQFAIGAGIGAASGLLYVRRNISRKRKPAQ